MTAPGPALEVRDVSVQYGGVQALANVSLSTSTGGFSGLIGPNGAGKTTLFNAITGLSESTGGMLLGGTDITGMAPDRRARLGIARSFQTPRVIEETTVYDNVMIGALTRCAKPIIGGGLRMPAQRRDMRAAQQRTTDQLANFGLDGIGDVRVRNLNHSQRRRVELARALASDPVVLLLDEPAAGMGSEDAHALFGQIEQARSDRLSVLLVEHSVDIVTRYASYIYVLDAGRLLAEGTPDEVVSNPAVINAYLGAPH